MRALEPEAHRLSLEQKVGQLLVVGFPGGKEGEEQLARAISGFHAGNVILFSRNAANAHDLFELDSAIHSRIAEATGLPPLIGVDQEGGAITRIREGLTPLPGPMAQAAAMAGKALDLQGVRSLGAICGTELAALGVNIDFAPVADVNNNPLNPAIGSRSYGDDPSRAAECAEAFAAGLADAGLIATAKHFPGHGDTSVDSHLDLPLVAHGRERLDAVELLPFRRLVSSGVGAVMVAHVLFPAVDPSGLPASLSKPVVEGLLRGELGHRGLVITDCLEMKAISGRFGDAAVLAIEAGVDLLCISHTFEVQAAAAKAIVDAVRSGRIPESRIDESVARILAAKSRLQPPPASWEAARRPLARSASLELAGRVSRASLVGLGRPIPPLGKGDVYIDIAPTNLTGAEDALGDSSGVRARRAAPGSVAAELAAHGAEAKGILVLSLPADPDKDMMAETLSLVAGRRVVMGLHGLPSKPGQQALARALGSGRRDEDRSAREFGAPSFVCMRGPWEAATLLDLLPERRADLLCAWEYTPLQARSVAEYLVGIIPAAGGCPVRLDLRQDRSLAKEATR